MFDELSLWFEEIAVSAPPIASFECPLILISSQNNTSGLCIGSWSWSSYDVATQSFYHFHIHRSLSPSP